MLKAIFKNYPLWFMLVWGCVMIGFIVVFIVGLNLPVLMGLMMVFYGANAIRSWHKERSYAYISMTLAVVFGIAAVITHNYAG
ncbi:hypothetical protein [Paenibacillus tengchongensis]|uniref:hypothetical protein n=1 Tax=Paenibacillus tengchongensis TaxID=2608684 RepID=UPI00124C0FAA|nr:hypothetical protein [Paenibacillus tengchongensis]